MRILPEKIRTVSIEILKSLGASEDEADLVTRNLLLANMRGIHTHGINFLPKVADRVGHGLMNIPSELYILSDKGAIVHIDGNNGFGQVAVERGMKEAIEKSKEYGVGLSLVKNTNHIGLLAFYSAMAAEEGMIGLIMCNSAPSMAPWGGAEAFFGTNPFSVAAPLGDEFPVVLDMSTSLVARGKIRRALMLKEKIPKGWAIDSKGNPTDDPAKAMEGTLMPVGGAKGYGMAFFVDLISGLLSGSSYSRDVLTFHKPLGPTGVGAMAMAINIESFMDKELFYTLAKAHVNEIRASKKAHGVERIYLPGEIERGTELKSKSEGVELDESTVNEINNLLEKQGIDIRLDQNE